MNTRDRKTYSHSGDVGRLAAVASPALLIGPIVNLAVGVLVSLFATACLAQSVSIVKITDEDSAIRSTGVAPALHNGQVAVLGREQATETDGIFVLPADGSGGYTTIVLRGDPVPNNPGRTFGLPSNPDIHNGVVTFEGGWQTSHDGVYTGTGSDLTVVVDSTINGGEPKVNFPDIEDEGISFKSIGQFEPPLFKGFGSSNVTGLSPNPPPGGGTSFATWELPYRGPSLGGGYAAFSAYVNHPGGVDGGVYSSRLATGDLELIANWQNVIPNRSENFEFFVFSDTDGVNVVFEGSHGNTNFDGFTGVYLAPIGSGGQGPFTIIAEHDQPTPDGNGTFHDFGDVAIDGELVVFQALIDNNSGVTNGIFGWRDGSLFKIIDDSDPLFGEETIDFSFTNRSLHNNQLVFRARYFDPDAPFNQGVGVYVATIDSATTANLAEFWTNTGQVLEGELSDLESSDDSCIRTRSGFGFSFLDLHHMELRLIATTEVTAPATLDVTVESRIDFPMGSGIVSLRNWNTDRFETVGSSALTMIDQVVSLTDIDASNYVNAKGAIELSIKHRVFVPRFVFLFDSFIDHVKINVR